MRLVLAGDADLAAELLSYLGKRDAVRASFWDPISEAQPPVSDGDEDPSHLVLIPGPPRRGRARIQSETLVTTLAEWNRHTDRGHILLISSAEIYGADHRANGFASESIKKRPALVSPIADYWQELESSVEGQIRQAAISRLIILRPVFLLGKAQLGLVNHLLTGQKRFRTPGCDPTIQFLHLAHLAKALTKALEQSLNGTFNVAPHDCYPLGKAIRFVRSGSSRVPWLGAKSEIPLLIDSNYMRHPCTASGTRFENATGVVFRSKESLELLKTECGRGRPHDKCLLAEADRFGMDEYHIRHTRRLPLAFFEKIYWRIQSSGIEHIPRSGGAILVGPHRGFMPLDGVMLVHLVARYANRMPRFLMHPTLVKFPVLARFMRRLGGIMACGENAQWALENERLLAVFPEGIRGAFKMYRDVYKLGRFGRPDYIHWAFRYNVPVIPFTIVGSAEIFPIFGKIPLPRLKQYLEWPFIPITPTFPLVPLPLPSKWRVQFLPPIDPQSVLEEAAAKGVAKETLFSEKVRRSIERATAELRNERRFIFW